MPARSATALACRTMLILVSLAAATATASPARDVRGELAAAIDAAGGKEALTNARSLAWQGTAVAHAGGRTIEIDGEWTVQPPDAARVTTWERSKGRESARSLGIEGDRGEIVRDGKSEPMPAAMLDHEREQFRLYDVIRLVPLQREGVTLAAIDAPAGQHAMRATGLTNAPVDLFFDASHRLVELRTTVVDPQSGNTVTEALHCSGTIRSAGVAWPKRIAIAWNGAPYFELEISELTITNTAR